jgi:hypothetical protein
MSEHQTHGHARLRGRRLLPIGRCTRLGALLACLGSIAFALPARAQERAAGKAAGAARGRVVTISEVTIVGRIQKPIAAVDVSRIQPKLTLAELRQPFLQGIEKAVYSSPF